MPLERPWGRGQRVGHAAAGGVGGHSLRQGIIIPTRPLQRVQIMGATLTARFHQKPVAQHAATGQDQRLCNR